MSCLEGRFDTLVISSMDVPLRAIAMGPSSGYSQSMTFRMFLQHLRIKVASCTEFHTNEKPLELPFYARAIFLDAFPFVKTVGKSKTATVGLVLATV